MDIATPSMPRLAVKENVEKKTQRAIEKKEERGRERKKKGVGLALSPPCLPTSRGMSLEGFKVTGFGS